MPYSMNPADWPGLESYPVLRELFELQIDMLFADIRVLLRLPEHQQEGGFPAVRESRY